MSRSVGFYQVPRALRIDENWKNLSFEYRHVFETILCHCAYKEITLDDYGVKIFLKPLQMLTTIRELVTLCNEPSVDRSLVERALKKFKNIDFSRQETRHRKTVITITQPDICEMIKRLNETRIETNSRQTRDKLETQKNKDNTEYNETQQQQGSADAEIFSCLKIPELEFSDQVSLMQTGMTERRMKEGVAFARKKKESGQIKTTFGACIGWYIRQDQFFPDLSEQMILAEKYLRELEAMRMETAVQLNENFRDSESLYVLLKGKETRISLKDPPGLVESLINDCLREVKEKFRHKIVRLESEKDKNDLEAQGNENEVGELP